jgi:cytidylate kinase
VYAPARTGDDGAVIPDPTVRRVAELTRAAPPRCGSTRVLCIDGPAGSGKSTLAAAVAGTLDAPVVNLDDLYAGWDQDLGAGLAARVGAWLLDAWQVGLPGRHLRYDWHAERYASWVEVPAAEFTILEGCGSAGRGIRERASAVVWIEAPRDDRMRRGLARDGAHMEPHWRTWAARELQHFADDATRAAADLIVDGVTGTVSPGTDSTGTGGPGTGPGS